MSLPYQIFCLECPVAITENGNSLAIRTDSIDVHAVAADHEVLMDHGIVDAQGTALLQSLIVVIPDGVSITHAQRQVAGSIFVKQGVIEKDAAF